MDITIKCPNCYQQVSKGNHYCIFCGYDLTSGSPEDARSIPASDVYADSSPESISYDGPRYCPRGHDVPDPSLGFCPTCGSPLVNEPSAGTSKAKYTPDVTSAPVGHRINRTCKCGYICDDPNLSFCPACGFPFDSSSPSDNPGWVCACGATNKSDMGFCVSCGNSRGWRPSEAKHTKSDSDTYIPSGMKPPKDDDLNIKSKYDN